MTPPRVLILNYEYPPVGGGAGVATRGLAVELARRGVGVDVVTSAWNMPPTHGPRPSPEPGSPGVCIHRVRCWRRGLHDSGLRGAATYLLFAVPVVISLLRRHQYTVAHLYFSLPTGVLLPLAIARGVPTVVSLRGSDVPGYDETNRGLEGLHRLLLPATRWIWRRAGRVVPVTEGLGAMARQFAPALPYTVIRNGVNLDTFRPNPAFIVGSGAVVKCISVGRLVPRKGHLCLLDAFTMLPAERFTLDIIGVGPLEQELRREVDRRHLAGRVRLLGALSQTALADCLRRADLFTMVPEHEAFGNAFAEALASGLPIVGTALGGIPELVEDNLNGLLVPPGNPQATAAAIRCLADDPERMRAMAVRNRVKAETELSWTTIADRYLQLYADLGIPSVQAEHHRGWVTR